ncbi:MAG: PAC2 family protein [Cellulomonadaceae bacterium TMED98]|nr:MAG: PAC2 family protein [Cellulomonadaceae bacterium TMED98]
MASTRLFHPVHPAPDVPSGLPLVAALTGFADAGSAVSLVSQYLSDTLESTEVGRFDNDEILDYRARRPIFQFDETHLTDYEPPRLGVDLVTDELGEPFLLLSGYEPDMRWEQVNREIVELVDLYDVSSTTWVHAIPMPVPHTRPLGVTVSGNREELTDRFSVWRPTTSVPGTMMHLVEYTLQKRDHPVSGFVVLVPHYLSDAEFPAAAVSALESITAATGRIFPTDALREQGRSFLAGIADQVENNEELQRLVGVLEKRHDSYMEDNPLASPLTDEAGEVPSAESIAQELQNFLAHRAPDTPDSSADQ